MILHLSFCDLDKDCVSHSPRILDNLPLDLVPVDRNPVGIGSVKRFKTMTELTRQKRGFGALGDAYGGIGMSPWVRPGPCPDVERFKTRPKYDVELVRLLKGAPVLVQENCAVAVPCPVMVQFLT